MALRTIDLGPVSSYAIAVEKGYTGTEAEWYELIHNVTSNAEAAASSASSAAQSAATAVQAVADVGTAKDAAIAAIQGEGNTQTAAVTAEGAAQIANVQAAEESAVDAVEAQQGTSEQAVYDKGVEQIAAVGTAGTTQIGLVQAEGATQIAAVEAKGEEVIESIPEDYSDLTEEVGSLKSTLDDMIPLLSDDATLLSDALTDKTYTGTGMSYILTGNVIEMSGTATGQSAFTALGSTTAAPPQWMLGGETYVFKLTNNTPAVVRFQAKTTAQTSIGTFAQFEQSGTYLLTIPEDITAFRLLIIVAQGVTANGTMTLEISNPIYSKDIFNAVYELPTTITALSTVSKSGYYLIKTANLSTYTDLPEGAEIATNGALLFVNYVSGTAKTQILDKRDHGLRWIRTIDGSTIGDWKVQDVVRFLKRFGNGNANDIPYLGCYAWGGQDTVLNVMPNANAGAIIHIPRDADTKYQIGLHYTDTGVYVRGYKSGTWSDWSRLAYLSDIPTQYVPLKPIIRYLQGSLDSGNATERIEVYLPCGDHYIAYFLYHYVVQDINCNCWRIMSFWRYDSSLNESTRVRLNANGELECAIRMKNRDDFSGGFAHGDEIMTGWNVFLDGEDITNSLSDYTSATPFNEFRLVRQSNMYDPADSTTLIAVHGCEYVFDGSLTLKINQSLKWAIAAELANCYMAMFTPLKTYTDHAYTDTEFTPIELPATHYSIIKPKAKKIVIYGENTGFLAEFSVEKYPSLATGDTARFTDNDGLAYNKCYFHVSAGGTTTVDELWQSTTVYKVIA